MREIIDFQEFELAVQNEEAPLTDPGLKSSLRHGEFIPGHGVKNGRAYIGDNSNELSVFDAVIDRAYSLKSDKEAWEFVETAVLRMVMVLGLPRTKTSETLCKAWIVDTLDIRVDMKRPDPWDRWANHIRYPRLSHLAQKNPETFCKFQLAMIRFVYLPDLASTDPEPPSPKRYTTSCYA